MVTGREKFAVTAGLVGAFALGGVLGNDAGRSSMILEDLGRDSALRAYADCILLRGKEACPKPPELSNEVD